MAQNAPHHPSQSIQKWKDRYTDLPAVVIGNGESRLEFDLSQIPSGMTTFGCNAIHRDFTPDFIAAVDPNMCKEIPQSDYSGKFIISEQRWKVYQGFGNTELEVIVFDVVRGWSAGPTAAYSALFMGFNPVFLLGFDMGHTPRPGLINNVYRDTANYRSSGSPVTHSQNWEKQFRQIDGEFSATRTVYQIGVHTLKDTWVQEASWEDLLRAGEAEVSPL